VQRRVVARLREAKIGDQQTDGRTERLQVPCDDEAGTGSPHDLGYPDFRRVTTTGTLRRIASSTVLPM